jgi:hypothetical protein
MSNYRRRLAERSWGVSTPTELVNAWPASRALKVVHTRDKITIREMARVTGLSKQTVSELIARKRKKVTRATEEAVLKHYGPDAHAPRNFEDKQRIPWEEHRWKMYGLFAQGWSATDLKNVLEQAGRNHGWVDHLSERKMVTYASVKQIDWLVETIGDKHGPSTNNKKRMARRGIFPLIHYTEEGKLIRGSLTDEQLRLWQGVR